jgi:hypothetical protein
VFFFFFETGPQWNIVDFLFFLLKKKQKKPKKTKKPKKKQKKKNCRLDFNLANAQEGWRLPFPLARRLARHADRGGDHRMFSECPGNATCEGLRLPFPLARRPAGVAQS